MKRFIFIILTITFLYPLTVYGSTFDIPETDITINIDEEVWDIFTKEDVQNEELMNDYGLDHNYMTDFFNSNHLYLDGNANLDGENTTGLLIMKTKNENKIVDLNQLEEKELSDAVKKFVENKGIQNYDIYTNENSTYIFYTFCDEEICGAEYYTVVNGDDYYIAFHSPVDLSDELIKKFDSVVDGITFNYKTKIKKSNSSEKKKSNMTKKESTIISSVTIVCFAFLVFLILFAKKRNK